jgi:AraC-like DNA-binding protein
LPITPIVSFIACSIGGDGGGGATRTYTLGTGERAASVAHPVDYDLPPVHYLEHRPCDALRSHVACYWTLRAGVDAAPHRVLPDGCMDLLFDLGERAVGDPLGAVVGAMTRAIVAVPTGTVDVFGVRFRPGAAPLFLGFAARCTRDERVPIVDALGVIGAELEERIATASDTKARIAIVEEELLARRCRLRSPPDVRIRAAIERMERTHGALPIDVVAGELGISARTMERAFDEWVGVGPKVFARTMRLQALVSAITREPGKPRWADLAVRFGFADQAHLVREVGNLAGVPPTSLVRERLVSDSSKPQGVVGTSSPGDGRAP